MNNRLKASELYGKSVAAFVEKREVSGKDGEREVVTALSNSWEIIGGVVGESLSAYVDDTTDLDRKSVV